MIFSFIHVGEIPHASRSSKDPLAATLEVEKRRRVEVGVGFLSLVISLKNWIPSGKLT